MAKMRGLNVVRERDAYREQHRTEIQ